VGRKPMETTCSGATPASQVETTDPGMTAASYVETTASGMAATTHVETASGKAASSHVETTASGTAATTHVEAASGRAASSHVETTTSAVSTTTVRRRQRNIPKAKSCNGRAREKCQRLLGQTGTGGHSANPKFHNCVFLFRQKAARHCKCLNSSRRLLLLPLTMKFQKGNPPVHLQG